MKLGIFYPVPVYYDGNCYTTDATQHHQFVHLAKSFDHIDLVVMLKYSRTEKRRQKLSSDGINIIALPFCRNGLELFLLKMPLWLVSIIKILWIYRKKWDSVIIYDITFINQFVCLFSYLFGIKKFLLLRGRHYENIRHAHIYDSNIKRYLSVIYSEWTKLLENFLVCNIPTAADYIPERNSDRFLFSIDATVKKEDIEKTHVFSSNSIKLLSVGRVVPIKGFEYLIEAVYLLKKRGTDVSLEIIGPLYGGHFDGYEYKLKNLIHQLEIDDIVKFTGALPFGNDLMSAYKRADIFVISSLSEGLPRVLCEAVAKGLPIVSTDVGEIPWFLNETEAGVTVKSQDSESLANAVLEVYNRRNRFSENALRNAYKMTAEVQMSRLADFIKQSVTL